jgi:hypothetical protein
MNANPSLGDTPVSFGPPNQLQVPCAWNSTSSTGGSGVGPTVSPEIASAMALQISS